MNTLDFDSSSVWHAVQQEWPELPWVATEFKHGAFHHVAVLGTQAVVRISFGEDHEVRTKGEFFNLAAISKMYLPFQTPSNLSDVYTTRSWSAVVSSFVDGEHRDNVEWTDVREALSDVLNTFQTATRPIAESFLPARQWCGGTNWPARVEEIIQSFNERERAAATHVVRNVLECEAEVQPTLVHGDFGLHNVLWTEGRITGVIDFDHAAIGDPAIDVAPLIGQFGASKLAQIYDSEMISRAKLHRASLSLQVAAAADLINDVKLRNHALRNFQKRFRDGSLYDPDAG